jgi:filamentous hemagglutinin family protein
MRSISKFFLIIILPIYATLIQAEVVLDGTLGEAVALEGPYFDIKAELGQQYGNNLFHSFKWFNLNKEETATFSGPDNITNIITRVTGGQRSSIDGQLISHIPQADLYLINPDGFIFGSHASLDLQGSLHISTASQLRLGDSGTFETRYPENSLLISAPPSAFGFFENQSATIEVERSRLTMQENQNLSILGGDILINRGQLTALSGRINLAAITKANLKSTPTGLDVDNNTQLGTIFFKDSSIDVGKLGRGDIYIRGGQFFLDNSDISVNTEVDQNSSVIGIDVNELHLNGSDIDSRAFGPEQGGQISIKVAGKTTLEGESYIRTSSMNTVPPAGNAGNIFLSNQSLELLNSTISTTTEGPGKGGNITIEVEHHFNLIGSVIQASSTSEADDIVAGDAGRIFIRARDLSLSGSARIDNSTFGVGLGGNISFEITDNLRLNDDAIISADSFGLGNAGNIYVHTTALTMNNGRISTSADNADGGNILINARTRFEMNNSLLSTTVSGGLGNGGNLAIGNPRFFCLTDSQVIANASGGNGGLILIITGTHFDSRGSAISASSDTGLDGEVKVDNIFNVDINTLPINFLDASALIEQHCLARADTPSSRFFIKGRGGLPNAPDDLQTYMPDGSWFIREKRFE